MGHPEQQERPNNATDEKDERVLAGDPVESEDGDGRKQYGVRQIEAITKSWSQRALWITFVLLYLVSFVDMLMQQAQTNLTPYVTSAFQQHALLSATSVMSTIIGGVSKLTIAKIVDIWGRVEGFILMIFLIILGLIMKAVCKNVETYAAAHVFYWVGHVGLRYLIIVFFSDMTSLKNRMVVLGINSTPSIATTFAGPATADAFYNNSTWRWAFGAFCIIMPAIACPVVLSFILGFRKAKKRGPVPRRYRGRSWFDSTKHYFMEFDVIGMLLTTAGFALVLLPLNLAASSEQQWKSGKIIAMIVIGVVCLIAFAIWEKFFAPVSYFPFRYLKDRTILGACVNSSALFISIYAWDIYFTSYLQVVNRVSISKAGYILNAYSLTSSAIAPFIGILIRYDGRFKLLGLGAIPFLVLGTALLIHFRHPGTNVGFLVMCQIFNGVAGGILSTCEQIAIMASVTHQEIAVGLALQGLFGSIGAAVGLSISGAIWTNLLPAALRHHLPEESKGEAMSIYASLETQLGYEWGTPVRDAIVQAYGEVQRKLVIAGAGFIPLVFISVAVWKNLNVKKIEQTVGNVF